MHKPCKLTILTSFQWTVKYLRENIYRSSTRTVLFSQLVNGTFVLNYREKVNLLSDLFSQQCKPVINDSVPYFSYLTNEKIEQMPIENEDVISLICKLNPNKANGSDGISGQMLLGCFTPQNNFRKYFINWHISRYMDICWCNTNIQKRWQTIDWKL